MPDHLPEDALPADPRGDLGRPDFPVAFRGYDRAAVDAYVERVGRIVDELTNTRSPRDVVRHAHEQVGVEVAGILNEARSTADATTAKAEADAAELRVRSEREAEQRYADAEQRVKDLDRDADLIWQERRRLIEDVRRLSESLDVVAREGEKRFPAESEPDHTVEIPAAELPDAELDGGGEPAA